MAEGSLEVVGLTPESEHRGAHHALSTGDCLGSLPELHTACAKGAGALDPVGNHSQQAAQGRERHFQASPRLFPKSFSLSAAALLL